MKYKITASVSDLNNIGMDNKFQGMIIEPHKEAIRGNNEKSYVFNIDDEPWYVYARFCKPLNWKERFK